MLLKYFVGTYKLCSILSEFLTKQLKEEKKIYKKN